MGNDQTSTPLTREEKHLIDHIKEARRARGLTQEQLSYELGMNSNYMGMVESYRRGFTLKTLFKIAKALRTNASSLLE